MTFTVKYRANDGRMCEEYIEAAGRSECVAKCKARGIAPTSVKECASPKTRRANGVKPHLNANGGQTRAIARISLPSKIIRVSLIAVTSAFIVFGVCWIVSKTTGHSQRENESKMTRKSAFIKDVKPAIAPKPVAAGSTNSPKKPDIIEKTLAELTRVRARMRNASIESLENLKRKEADLEKLLVDKKMQFYMTNVPHVAYQPFKTSTEQVMDWIFNCNVGDDPPPFVPPLDPGEMANIGAILDRANDIVEEDTPDTAARKKMVELAKQELKQYLAQGGSASEFLHYYHQQLVTAHELRMDASRVVREYARDASPEDARRFLEETNKVLADKGIGPAMLSDKMKEKIGIPIEEEKNER